jgi:pyridoxine kinase
MQDREAGAPCAVIVISSHVARGSVGNRAAVFALETLGHPVWAVPTVILPWHPGHGIATRIVPDPSQFFALMRDLENAPWLGEVGAVLSGYLGAAGQAGPIASLVAAVRARNPDALYVCDPVMGDADGLYVPDATAEALRDGLMPIADIATPNRYELAWMSRQPLESIGDVIEAARACATPTMLVTSAPSRMTGGTGNLLLDRHHVLLAEHRVIERPAKGVGDLLAAVFLARLLAGQSAAKALQSTTAAVFEVLARAAKRGADELTLETDAQSLSQPMAVVHLRHLPDSGNEHRA